MTRSSPIARAASALRPGRLILAGAALAVLAGTLPAAAQMSEDPWQFKRRDRAGLAVVMKQAEAGAFSSATASATAGVASETTVLMCGGGDGGTASATANSSCIILNNATGDLSIGQDALGDQSARNTQTGSALDDVEDILASPTGTPE